MSAQFGENGRIVRIEADGGTAASGPARAFLVDLSGVRDNAEALEFTWDTGTPRESRYRVEGSSDLQQWEVVQERVTLVELQRGSQRLLRDDRMEHAKACFEFLPTRSKLDLLGWEETDIFAHS